MKQKKLTVTIGIPVYNEERNIGKLLQRIVDQKQISFSLEKIIVVSDACKDDTNKIAQSFEKVTLITHTKRMGQCEAQNEIIKKTKTDVLVLLEADTLPQNKRYIEALIKPILHDHSIALVQGDEEPLPAQSILGRVIFKQFRIYHAAMTTHQDLISWISSGRGGRAFSRKLYAKLHWPHHVPEDVFAHLWAKQNGYTTAFAQSAVCLYKSPETYADITREMRKVAAGAKVLTRYFPCDLWRSMYRRSFQFTITCAVQFLLSDPFSFCLYLLLLRKSEREALPFSDAFPVTVSTKSL